MAEPLNSQQQPSEDPLDLYPDEAERSSQALYQQGVSAFKAKNYELALSQFQAVEQFKGATPTDRLKAQMGMVQVYQQLGNEPAVRARCQVLLNSSSPKVRQWASQRLMNLPPSPDAAGVDPVIATPRETPPSRLDRTGFVPIDSTSPPTSPPSSAPPDEPQPGFVPLDPPSSLPLNSSPKSRSLLTPPSPPDLSFSPEAPEPAFSESTHSLFHYERLNEEDGGEPQGIAPPVDRSPPQASKTQENHSNPAAPSQPPTAFAQFKPRPLPQRPLDLWGVQVITMIATIWVIDAGLSLILRSINRLLRSVRWPIQLNGFSAFDQPHTILVVIVLMLVALASPWLMDRLLAWGYNQRTLSTRQLQSEHPHTLNLLRQICRHQGWQLPELRLIPDDAPLCFSYGWLPRNTRIVVSQGLLKNSSADDIMAFYSYELAHIANRDLPVLSAVGLLLLLLHTSYWQLARWGNTLPQALPQKGVGILASGVYGMFWLLRKLGLWLSRVRAGWADQQSTALTQRPDLQQQGLMQFAQQIIDDVSTRGYLHPLLNSLDMLLPLNPQAALSPGSFVSTGGLSPMIAMDGLNPYRQWLMANASHPPLGQRLQYLNQQAVQRRQATLVLADSPLIAHSFSLTSLLRQKAPLLGLLLGGGCALGLWFLGGVVNRFGWQRLSWVYQDPSILQGGLLLGLGMGILLRINTLYPDIDVHQSLATTPDDLLTIDSFLPVKGQPRALEGKLMGPPGLANWLGQDLYLATLGGVVKLATSPLLIGWQALIRPTQHPSQWMGRIVNISGWQRWGGGLLWLDVAQIGVAAGRPRFTIPTPQWDMLVGLGLSLWGILTIFTGGG